MWTQRARKWTNPLYDSDPSESFGELQVCKLPTVWITPVENRHDSSSMNAHLSPRSVSGPGFEARTVRGFRSANEQIMPSNLNFEGIVCQFA
jgi:hypothetical protein